MKRPNVSHIDPLPVGFCANVPNTMTHSHVSHKSKKRLKYSISNYLSHHFFNFCDSHFESQWEGGNLNEVAYFQPLLAIVSANTQKITPMILKWNMRGWMLFHMKI